MISCIELHHWSSSRDVNGDVYVKKNAIIFLITQEQLYPTWFSLR